MPLVEFVDPAGKTWQVWEVQPQTDAAAPAAELPRDAAGAILSRRSAPSIPWLCFDSHAERRRFAPVPEGWTRASETQLSEWCAEAHPARRAIDRLVSSPALPIRRPEVQRA